MTRRALLALMAGAVIDPERLLWQPGRKLISIPRPTPTCWVGIDFGIDAPGYVFLTPPPFVFITETLTRGEYAMRYPAGPPHRQFFVNNAEPGVVRTVEMWPPAGPPHRQFFVNNAEPGVVRTVEMWPLVPVR
jgi:hypothetical protein